MATPDPSFFEVPQWLKSLPLAPEYHPTLAEFQDPISYILKIEKEASSYGICKIVPPLPAAPRKTAISNINRSFAARGGAKERNFKRASPTFSTRQQQIGFCPRRPRPVQKPVWQSGEEYTLVQFEAKAKQFERAQLRRCSRKASGKFTDLEVESLFWKASADKPVVVEYANDIPGSGFAPRLRSSLRKWKEEDAVDVGDTAWNMRGVSREKGSLLKFMKEEIPGVTSPMVYVAMMFSWFAWHIEDHELHSLNYLHLGAAKTWYGVPRDARFAFEEVVRVHGYGGDVNPLVTFALLGEKTTVMSPEVLVGAGIPCCRLVQNAGEFIVTFPGSYHCGFSHGYNCGEASNIATPEWLKFAKEAAVRRASINVPPMVSHFQLLFELAMSIWSRVPLSGVSEPRSSRLKDKLKGEGEVMVKEIFARSIIENNNLLDILIDKGAYCVILPQRGFGVPFSSNSQSRTQMKTKSKLSFGSCNNEVHEHSRGPPSDEPMLDSVTLHEQQSCSLSLKRKHLEIENNGSCTSSDSQNRHHGKESTLNGEVLLDQGLLSCVTCGILSFSCVAIVQPSEDAAMFLMSANSATFMNQSVGMGAISHGNKCVNLRSSCERIGMPGFCYNNCETIDDNLEHTYDQQVELSDHIADPICASAVCSGPSALDLLAFAYGDLSSDDEADVACKEKLHPDVVCFKKQSNAVRCCESDRDSTPVNHISSGLLSGHESDHSQEACKNSSGACWSSPKNYTKHHEVFEPHPAGDSPKVCPGQSNDANLMGNDVDQCLSNREREQLDFGASSLDSSYKSKAMATEQIAVKEEHEMADACMKNPNIMLMQARPDKDSSRMHVFCLEHAAEVEKQLSPIGGVNIMLLCHPDYPAIEAQAKLASKELGINYIWKDISFREATEEDQERIQSALEDEEVIPINSDWAVKMGINLYYSANLSKSPLYNKQMPYNPVIYKAFGRDSSGSSPGKLKVFERRRGKKLTVAGRWCGKAWMSNQIHPYVIRRSDPVEQAPADKFDNEIEEVLDREASDVRPVKPPTVPTSDVNNTSAITLSRKRKKPDKKLNAMKPRNDRHECFESPEDSTENSLGHSKMIRRSARKNQISISVRNEHAKTPQFQDPSLDSDLESGPHTRLRSRPSSKGPKNNKPTTEKHTNKKKGKQHIGKRSVESDELNEYSCDVEGCNMSFGSKQDLTLHKRNICPVKGCGKKFFSHKYLVQHRRVHTDDRPLKCPWKGCKMTFKWAWARTEHIRVHTGDRPYVCMVSGCGQTFRFVSDFSRHKRKTGHISKKVRR